MENSLDILSESLDQKIAVLKEIQEYNAKQEEAFDQGQPDLDGFDAAMEEKDKLIERLARLDDGFENLYTQIAEQLKADRERYKDQIGALQEKISCITEMSVTIQAQEARNKKLIEAYFAKQRTVIGQGRKGSKAAYDYYKNMSNKNLQTSQYMDSKN